MGLETNMIQEYIPMLQY